MYLPATSTFIALASLALSSTSALVIPSQEDSTSSHLVKREPHFFQVREPSSGYTLYSPNPAHSGSSGSFEFKALDGEQSSEFHVKVFLQAESGNREELANIPFDGYVAAATVSVPFDSFPDGSYTLVAEEFANDGGKFAGKITQPFYIEQSDA